MIAVLRHVSDSGSGEGARWAGMRIHRIASPVMIELGYSSKLNAEWEFLTMLRDEGRHSAAMFLDAHAGEMGRRSTLDLDALLEHV
jgi:NTE family protein